MDQATIDKCVVPVSASFDKDGYPRKKWNKRIWRMNRLIWTWCFGDIPDNHVVAHRCNNKGCVNPNHLYLCTAHLNSTHASRDGLYLSGEDSPKAKLKQVDVDNIRSLYGDGISQQKIGEMYGMSQSGISSIIRKETW